MAAIAKCILILVNSIFMVVSIVFIAAGAILAFTPELVLDEAYNSVMSGYNQAASGYSLPESSDELSDVPFFKSLGIGLFVLGIFLFAIAFLAYVGACCTSCCRCVLVLYCIVVIIFIIVEVVLGTMFFVSDSALHDEARSQLKDMVKDDYDEMGTDTFSTALNLIHQYFDCCGIDSSKDFGAKSHRSCEAAYLNTGCYSKLQDEIDNNIIWCGLGLAALCLLQVIEVVCAILIFKENKVGPV